MSICNQPCLVASIMFGSKHKVDFDPLVVIGCILEFRTIPGCRSHILKNLSLLDLIKFKINCLLPLGVSILLVNHECILVISGEFKTIFVSDSCSDLVKSYHLMALINLLDVLVNLQSLFHPDLSKRLCFLPHSEQETGSSMDICVSVSYVTSPGSHSTNKV